MNSQIIEETQETTETEKLTPREVKRTIRREVPSVPTENPPEKVYKTNKAIFRTYQVVWYILGLIEVLLTFRLLLKFIGANSFSGFTSLIYSLSNPFALPFTGVIPPIFSGRSELEWSTFVAMAVYAVLAWGIIEFFQLVKPVDREEVKRAIESQ